MYGTKETSKCNEDALKLSSRNEVFKFVTDGTSTPPEDGAKEKAPQRPKVSFDPSIEARGQSKIVLPPLAEELAEVKNTTKFALMNTSK